MQPVRAARYSRDSPARRRVQPSQYDYASLMRESTRIVIGATSLWPPGRVVMAGSIAETYAVTARPDRGPARRRTATRQAEAMARFLDFTKYDKDDPGVAVDAERTLELKRLANLFLVSGITLLVFLTRAFAEVLSVTFIPRGVFVAWGGFMLLGWAMSFVYGLYVTFLARRWAWLALCAIPFTCVPAGAAYAWTRRQEIEREVFDGGAPPSRRQKSGGRRKRR